jgi:putative component of toxin-antitoxin plasmid stabilization module
MIFTATSLGSGYRVYFGEDTENNIVNAKTC